MPCTNCNCGKADNIKKKVAVETETIDDNETLNRLYLLGFLCNPTQRRNISSEDEILNQELANTFSSDVAEENYELKLINPTLIEFFNLNKSNDFQATSEFLSRIPKSQHKHFWRGYIDYTPYSIHVANRITTFPTIEVAFVSENLFASFLDFLGISECSANVKREDGLNILEISHSQALDVMHDLYADTNFIHRRSHWVSYILSTGNEDANVNNSFQYMKKRPDAIAPFKARASDSGYDLTILEKVKTVGDVEFYDTGIIVIPAYGYYFDVVPRSSISKTGYMLANSVGIIDMSYRGSILVPLRKVDKNAPDLELPNRIVQIIPREIIHINFQEVKNFEQTSRNDGGFGSTNAQ